MMGSIFRIVLSKRKKGPVSWFCGCLLVGSLSSCCEQTEEELEPVVFTEDEFREIHKLSPLPDLPPSPTNAFADNPAAARFGQKLFFDSRLSANGEVSCATCHDPSKGFADGRALAEGLSTTNRHSQSLWNMGYQRWFFWDGRTDSLWAQALQPLFDEKEMGATVELVRKVVNEDAALSSDYKNLFGPGSGHRDDRFLSNLGKSIEAYERKLISKESAFDQFVADPTTAVFSESAKRGLRIFVGRGQCTSCHSGPNFSDREFHNIGLARNFDVPRDLGRYVGIRKVKSDRFNGTGEFSDDRSEETNIKLRYLVVKTNNLSEFKTPGLRNVAHTAPYMHDGRFGTLREVFDHYSRLPGEPPLGHREETLTRLNLSDREMEDLEAFLRSLTGRNPDQALMEPLATGE